MSAAIVSFGTSVPDTILTLREGRELARNLCAQNDAHISWLPSMYDHTGIRKRHTTMDRTVVDRVLAGHMQPRSPPSEREAPPAKHDIWYPTGPGDRGPTTGMRMQVYRAEAPPQALKAAANALARSPLPTSAITHLITVSCTGFFAPGIDRILIEELGLASDVERTHIGFMGCHGALNGLRVARAILEADSTARVLLCAVELCSLHYHYGWDPQQIVANAIFADGAAAVVCMPGQQVHQPLWRVRATGSCLLANSADAMTWTIGEHGFDMTLARNVASLIAQNLRPWLTGWLSKSGLDLSDVVDWAVHPGGPNILTAVDESLDLPSDALAVSREVFAEYGNMSSPTVLFVLERLAPRKKKGPCVALGFGPGLATEATLLE